MCFLKSLDIYFIFHIIMILLTAQNVLLPTIFFVIRVNWSLLRGKFAFVVPVEGWAL